MSAVAFRKASAAAMPTISLVTTSSTWETAVGIILLWPWKYPRKALMMQISSTQGPRQPMAAQASGWFQNRARGRQKAVIKTLPTMPSSRKIRLAVAYTCRTWA